MRRGLGMPAQQGNAVVRAAEAWTKLGGSGPGLTFAECVPACEAAVVIQHVVIQYFTNGRTGCTPCGTAEQAADDGSCNEAEGGSDRTTHQPCGGPEFGARHGSGHTACGTGHGANCAPRLACLVSGFNTCGLAARTFRYSGYDRRVAGSHTVSSK